MTDSTLKTTFVGECSPYSSDPADALLPHPPNSAGSRLRKSVLGASVEEYLALYGRANLCSRRWDLREARRSARRLEESGAPLVLLGARVCLAFRVPFRPFSSPRPGWVALPHPSGRCHVWNDPGTYDLARRALASVGVEARPPCR